jgi:hypothetical protein
VQTIVLRSFGVRCASKTEANRFRAEDLWRRVGKDQDFDSFFSKIGPDSTSGFDKTEGDSMDFANSEATNAATAVDGDDEALEEEDDDDAALEEDDEDDEIEDVEDDADLNR